MKIWMVRDKNMAHAGGRPTKYEGEETIKKSLAYIESCKDNHGLEKEVKLPTAEGLSLVLGIRRETLYDWAKEYEEFHNILDILNKEQANRLLNNGLSGFYNATIAKLVLAKHGYKEESDITSGGEKIEPVLVKFLDEKKSDSN